MKNAAILPIVLSLLLSGLMSSLAQPAAPQGPADSVADDTVKEAVRRAATLLDIRSKLGQAEGLQKRGYLQDAAKVYAGAWAMCVTISLEPTAPEVRAIVQGATSVRFALARLAMRQPENMQEAADHVGVILEMDPRNAEALDLKKQIEKEAINAEGSIPDRDTMNTIPDLHKRHIEAATLVQDGRVLYEMDRLEEANRKLSEALKLDPQNQAAYYYKNLVSEREYNALMNRRDSDSRGRIVEIQKAWANDKNKNNLPVPNPFYTNDLIYTSPKRQAIDQKLKHIRLDSVGYMGVPLSDVVRTLGLEAQRRDPEKRGLNFLIDAGPTIGVSSGPVNPETGQVESTARDLGSEVFVKVDPPIRDLTIKEALDVICRMAGPQPIKYSIEDYAIVFTPKGVPTPDSDLVVRIIKINPNTFMEGLEGVQSSQMMGGGMMGGGYGGGMMGGYGGQMGGYGGGSYGGYGGMQGGYGGGSYGGYGGMQGGYGGGSYGGYGGMQGGYGGGSYGGYGGMQGAYGGAYGGGAYGGGAYGGGAYGGGAYGGGAYGGGAYGGGAYGGGSYGGYGGGSYGGYGGYNGGVMGSFGGQGQPLNVGSMTGVPRVNATMGRMASGYSTASVQQMAKQFFNTVLGVDLSWPKAIWFNDREGSLLLKATTQDLDMIEAGVQLLNIAAPQVNLKVKFLEVTQTDSSALGFQTYLGNILANDGSIVASAGTAPSYTGSPSAANPNGSFPPGPIAPSASDNLLSGGLRNQLGAPALATFTGILTDPQFRFVINALEQRDGADLLNEASVTTMSGRQTEITMNDIQSIITSTQLITSTPAPGANAVPVVIGFVPQPSPTTFGPTLDVVPYVCADGFTVQMSIIPTLAEFIGYDNPGQFVMTAQTSQGVSSTAVLPLPHFRVRQVTTELSVWDGETVVLGGLIAETVQKTKDKIPFLGDLPLVGRVFRSESSTSVKKNLMIFVTPTIIDPAGNKVHNTEDLPFAAIGSTPAIPLSVR